MAYNPVTDFLALWRNNAGVVTKTQMPGLDFVVSALARAGFITLAVSATPPVVNQSTTAWLQAAVPSHSGEGVMWLWDAAATAYVAATPALLFKMLEAAAGDSGVSWWTSTGGPPLNTVGVDGDFAIQLDEPGGIFGPKFGGAWPVAAVPGSVNEVTSIALDNTFGNTPGQLIYRDVAVWAALPIGPTDAVLNVDGGLPVWDALTSLLDTIFGSVQGSILFRDAAAWDALPPGVANQILATGGPGANPAWAPRTAEFISGTVMVFHQTDAPVGWTKDVTINDYGLRVTNGTVGITPGVAFSTVFAQTAVGNTTIGIPTMPPHFHSEVVPSTPVGLQGGGTYPTGNIGAAGSNTGSTGGGGAHTHSVTLNLAYVDIIIASKD